MANVILGLLLLSPMSLYDLLQAFGAGVSLVYSASSGSIKRALDDLVARGLVEVDQVRPGARGRKVHRVNDAGRQAFETWMRSELTEPDSERAILSRLYFLGLLDDAGRHQVVENIHRRTRSDLERLEELRRRLDAVEVPEDLAEVARFQCLVLEWGLASNRSAQQWLDEHLSL